MKIIANIAGQGNAQFEIQQDRIASVQIVGSEDSTRPYISPGFIDLQINGFAGVDFSDPMLEAAKAIRVLTQIWQTGVTTFCPTLITNTIDQLECNFRVLEEARRLDRRFDASVPGYHLEGPYLSAGKSHGAHRPQLMHAPDWDEFRRLQEAAGGRILIVTIAPELPGACDFIHRACTSGIIASIGHTDAAHAQIHAAVDAGATLCTHLGNGCPEYLHRHQNTLWAQLASERLRASLICDGFHIPPDFVRVTYRIKGDEACILITDAIHAAKLPPGRYSLVGQSIELLPTGQVVTTDRQSMAGSSLSMNRAIAVFAEYAQISLAHAILAATRNPAALLGRAEICAGLVEGQIANLVLFTPGKGSLDIKSVILRGEVVYSSGLSPSDRC